MQHLEGSGTPVLYIGRKVLKVTRTRMMASRGQDSSGLGSEQVVISSEHGSDAGRSIKCEEFD